MKKVENKKKIEEMKEEFLSDLYKLDEKVCECKSKKEILFLITEIITKYEN